LADAQERGLLNVNEPINPFVDMGKLGYPPGTPFCPRTPGNITCSEPTFVHLMEMSSGFKEPLNCDDNGTM
jgi:hypothetical protein